MAGEPSASFPGSVCARKPNIVDGFSNDIDEYDSSVTIAAGLHQLVFEFFDAQYFNPPGDPGSSSSCLHVSHM